MILLKSKQEVAIMTESARKLKAVLRGIKKSIRTGVTTIDIDAKAEKLIRSQKAKPAFKGYRGFPSCACTSLNDVVVHGIPSKDQRLGDGDIISVDMGLIHEGYYSDAARTWPVGNIPSETTELIEVAKRALYVGMVQVKVGNRIGDVSHAIQEYVESHGFSVVRDFVGHGIGRSLHEDPQVPNFGKPGRGPKLEVGMVIAIEPMVVAGGYEVDVLEDSWTVVTRDHTLAAHYEDTIALTEKGPVNLTGAQKYEEE
jgi:methionyl aminopeptidase